MWMAVLTRLSFFSTRIRPSSGASVRRQVKPCHLLKKVSHQRALGRRISFVSTWTTRREADMAASIGQLALRPKSGGSSETCSGQLFWPVLRPLPVQALAALAQVVVDGLRNLEVKTILQLPKLRQMFIACLLFKDQGLHKEVDLIGVMHQARLYTLVAAQLLPPGEEERLKGGVAHDFVQRRLLHLWLEARR